MSIGIGLIVLLAVIALIMAICHAANRGGPLMLPVAVILLALAIIIERVPH